MDIDMIQALLQQARKADRSRKSKIIDIISQLSNNHLTQEKTNAKMNIQPNTDGGAGSGNWGHGGRPGKVGGSMKMAPDTGGFGDGGSSEEHEYTMKTLQLPPKEYGKVLQSINNVFHARYNGKRKGTIAIDNSIYSFEIKEYNEYNIYSKDEND